MKPTPDNVLPEYQMRISIIVHEIYKQQGAILSLVGGGNCPWCNSDMKPKNLGSFLGVCASNPEQHIVQWIPWGG